MKWESFGYGQVALYKLLFKSLGDNGEAEIK